MEQDLRYPIGKFRPVANVTPEQRNAFIAAVEATPAKLGAAVANLSVAQLDTPYREGGWTVRQVVHHLADSHMNSFVRFKLALTEDAPTIKPYDEALWAELPDAKSAPIEQSLVLFVNLHKRWVTLLRAMKDVDWSRKLNHPERGVMSLDDLLALYAWHGPHHIAQITSLNERNGWN